VAATRAARRLAQPRERTGQSGAIERLPKRGLRADDDQLALAGVRPAHRVQEQHGARLVGDLRVVEVQG
jgi:hypothetical protein